MTTVVRSYRVEIETPEDDNLKTVQYHRHALTKDADGKTTGYALEQPRPLGFHFLTEARTLRHFRDPVTGYEGPISVAGIAAAIQADYDARRAAEVAAPPPAPITPAQEPA